MKKFWFNAKNYGWGWYPATWQGWFATLLYVVVLIWSAFTSFDSQSTDMLPPQVWRFISIDFVATIALLILAWRTGEKPTWRWGKKM